MGKRKRKATSAPLPTAPYTPDADDPPALTIACPVCPAPIGTWCGGKGDVHQERLDALASR